MALRRASRRNPTQYAKPRYLAIVVGKGVRQHRRAAARRQPAHPEYARITIWCIEGPTGDDRPGAHGRMRGRLARSRIQVEGAQPAKAAQPCTKSHFRRIRGAIGGCRSRPHLRAGPAATMRRLSQPRPPPHSPFAAPANFSPRAIDRRRGCGIPPCRRTAHISRRAAARAAPQAVGAGATCRRARQDAPPVERRARRPRAAPPGTHRTAAPACCARRRCAAARRML